MADQWWFVVFDNGKEAVAASFWDDRSPATVFRPQFGRNTNPLSDWVILMDTDDVFVMMFCPGGEPTIWVSARRSA